MDELVELRARVYKIEDHKERLLCVSTSKLHPNAAVVNSFYESLSNGQKKIFELFHRQVSLDRGTIQVLDSEPGTGKTFFIGATSNTLATMPTYCVYKTELKQKMKNLIFNSETVASLTMRLFNVPYRTTFHMYQNVPSVYYILLKLATIVKKSRKSDNSEVIIIDEYTILNPEQVVALCLYGIYHKKHLFFVGDRCQQNSIEASSQHSRMSNYFLLEILCDESMILDRPMRCQDETYNQKLKDFRQLLLRSTGNTTLTFHYLYKLYELFKSKFYTEVDFRSTYFAAWHSDLTLRTNALRAFLIKTNVKYKAERWSESNIVLNDRKFAKELLLIPGYTYIYIKKVGGQMPYGQAILKSFTDDSVTMKLNEREYVIKKEQILQDQILESFYLNFNQPEGLFQYALWPVYVSTYHNAQGLTISNDIELNLHRATCESVYVGLSRIRRGEQLIKIHVENGLLQSLEYTEQQNDEYYYKVAREQTPKRRRLEYIEVDSVGAFESKDSVKIKRKLYLEQAPIHDTPLMSVCRIIKENPGGVLEHLFRLPAKYDVNPFKDNLDPDGSICKSLESICQEV
jgi:hypothetical protein